MLYVFGGIPVDPARIEEVTAEAARFEALCNEEEGCIEYSLAWRAAEPGFLRLLEVWDSKEAHAVHTGQPHVLAWTAFISGAALAPPTFTKYIVDVIEP